MENVLLTEKLKHLTEKARSLRMNLFLVYVFEEDYWACSVIHPDHREEDLGGDTFENIIIALENFFQQWSSNVTLFRPKK